MIWQKTRTISCSEIICRDNGKKAEKTGQPGFSGHLVTLCLRHNCIAIIKHISVPRFLFLFGQALKECFFQNWKIIVYSDEIWEHNYGSWQSVTFIKNIWFVTIYYSREQSGKFYSINYRHFPLSFHSIFTLFQK